MGSDTDRDPETRVTVWPASRPWGPLRRALLGLSFILLVMALLTASVGAYLKWFTPSVWVSVVVDHTGLQLDRNADVKLRGVLVGEVRSVGTDGSGAKLSVALDPGQVAHIPAGVTAELLPKTLFGEKYVELVPPARVTGARVAAGAVIRQDRSAQSVELEKVVDDLMPVLEAVHPQALSATLSAVARAVSGRGEQIGDTLVRLESYLKTLNGELPVLQSDLKKLATVLDTYSATWPDLATVLSNLTVTSGTVVEQRVALSQTLDDVTGAADTASGFLMRHEGRLVQVGQVSRPLLEVLAGYAPEYPCLTAGLVRLQQNVEGAFGDGRLHITLEITKDNGKYVDGEQPLYGADIGRNCQGMPDDVDVPAPEYPITDGYSDGGSGGGTGYAAMGYAGSAEEQAVVKALVAGATGQNVTRVSDFDALMWGSLMRGATVNAR